MRRTSRALSIALAVVLVGGPRGAGASARAGEPASRVVTVRVPGATSVVRAATGADGTIHVLFDAADGPRYVSSKDAGVTFSAPLAVVDAAGQKPGLTFSCWDLAVGKDGAVHAALGTNAWKLKLPKEQWSFHDATLAPGAKSFSPVRNLNRKASEGYSLAADGRGAVAACFLADRLFAMVSHDEGATFGTAAEVNPAWNPCNCCTTSAAYGADGRLAVLYREETNDDRDMYVVVWDQKSGKSVRTRVSTTTWKVSTCPMTYFSIARAGTGYVAAWPTKGQVSFAHLDKDGAVVAPGEIHTAGTTGMRTGVVALTATDGATLIAWKDKDVLGWQMYDAKGASEGAAGSAPSAGSGAAGVVLTDGRFVLFP